MNAGQSHRPIGYCDWNRLELHDSFQVYPSSIILWTEKTCPLSHYEIDFEDHSILKGLYFYPSSSIRSMPLDSCSWMIKSPDG